MLTRAVVCGIPAGRACPGLLAMVAGHECLPGVSLWPFDFDGANGIIVCW